MGGKGGSSPDVAGAARVEGIENRKTARDATFANRPDQFNPFGSVQWEQQRTKDPASGENVTRWTQKQQLAAPYQRLVDDETDTLQVYSGMRNNALNRAAQDMQGGADFEQFGEGQGLEYDPSQLRQRAEDAAYGRATSRLVPQFNQREGDTEVKLRNQGLRPGDEAYDRAMGNFNRSRNDAYEQARMGAVGTGRAEAGQAYNQQRGSAEFANALRDKNVEEYLSKRKYNLQEAEALNPITKAGEAMSNFSGA